MIASHAGGSRRGREGITKRPSARPGCPRTTALAERGALPRAVPSEGALRPPRDDVQQREAGEW